MNRELRDFDLESKKMRHFTLDSYDKNEHDCYGNIMQMTGLYDTYGKGIYKGDILKGNHKDNFVIVELNGGLQMLNVNYYGQKHNELIASPTCDPQTKSWLNDAEVIGNIYEHPHLLTN